RLRESRASTARRRLNSLSEGSACSGRRSTTTSSFSGTNGAASIVPHNSISKAKARRHMWSILGSLVIPRAMHFCRRNLLCLKSRSLAVLGMTSAAEKQVPRFALDNGSLFRRDRVVVVRRALERRSQIRELVREKRRADVSAVRIFQRAGGRIRGNAAADVERAQNAHRDAQLDVDDVVAGP